MFKILFHHQNQRFYHLDFLNVSVYYSFTKLRIIKVRPNDVLTLTRHEGVLQDGV